jgi:D-alanyl-lipoteichoic acid acyltransferase DltB (MBOAT superfamily)
MITMVLGGLWHGASWRFIIWGTLHGVALTLHKMFKSWTDSDPKEKTVAGQRFSHILNVFITFHFVCFCWIFFRASSMETVADMVRQILYHLHPEILFEFVAGYKAVVFLMLLGYLLHFIPSNLQLTVQKTITEMPLAYKAAFMLLIIIMVIQTNSAGIQPFIYFQF